MVSGGVIALVWPCIRLRSWAEFLRFTVCCLHLSCLLSIIVVSLLTEEPTKEMQEEFEEARKPL